MTALDVPARSLGDRKDSPGDQDGRSVVAALARLEARRLARHPLIWAGVALGALLLIPTVWPFRFVLPRESIMVQLSALPIAAATLVAAHLGTTRTRRDAVTEQTRPAPRGEDERTLAMLAAVLGPTLVTAALVALLLGAAAAMGGVGPVWWAEAATAPALVAGGGMIGVLLGRIAPGRMSALFGVVALAVVQLLLSDAIGGPSASDAMNGPGGRTPTELLAPAVLPSGAPADPAALLRPAAAHLIYVLAMAGAIAAAAALISRTTRRRTIALIAAVAVACTAGVAQLRPPDDAKLQAVLTSTSDPTAIGHCTTDDTSATVCALPLYSGWQAGWADLVHAVRSPLTERGVQLQPLTVTQYADPSQARFETSRWYDPDDVDTDARLQAARDAEDSISDGTVLLTSGWPRGSDTVDPSRLELALHTARETVGLPGGFAYVHLDVAGTTEVDGGGPTEGLTTCTAVGQAREAVTMWLAAQADPAAAGALHRALDHQPYPGTPADPVDDGSGIEDVNAGLRLSGGAVSGLTPQWSKPGAYTALQMLELPTGDVFDELANDWARWTNPHTSLKDLVDHLGISGPPVAADLQQQMGGGPVREDLKQFFRDTPLAAPSLDETGTAVLDVHPAETGAPQGCP